MMITKIIKNINRKENNVYTIRKIRSIGIFLCLVVIGAINIFKLSCVAQAEENDVEPGNPESNMGVTLEIDNTHIYDGMNESFSDGYIPVVEGGYAKLVVPIICRMGSVNDNQMNVEIGLGDSESNPFVNRNYCKTIQGQATNDLNGNIVENVYLISANLELKKDRVNGSYPVEIVANGYDQSGNTFSQSFTIYVIIKDGINPNMEPATEAVTETTTEEAPTFTPKILVDSVKVDKGKIVAGEEVEVTVTLKNNSKSEAVKNMMVTVSAPNEQFSIISASDSFYVDGILAGGTTDITLSYFVKSTIPQGQYNLTLAMEYANYKGVVYSESVNAKLDVVQPVNVEFDPLQYVNSAKMGETIDVTMCAMNLGRGKVYNVRGTIICDGLEPSGTIYIGDMDAGTKQVSTITAIVSSLKNGSSDYGTSDGTITYYYEDELGNTYEKKDPIQITVNSPFSEPTADVKDEPNQWWILVAVLLGIIVIIGIISLIRNIRNSSKNTYDSESEKMAIDDGEKEFSADNVSKNDTIS